MGAIKVLVIVSLLGGEPAVHYTITSDFVLKEFLTPTDNFKKAILLDVKNNVTYTLTKSNTLLKLDFQGYGKWFSSDLNQKIVGYESLESQYGGKCIRVRMNITGLDQLNDNLGIELDNELDTASNQVIREICEIPAIFDFLPKDKKVLSFLSFYHEIDIPEYSQYYWFETLHADHSNNVWTEYGKIQDVTFSQIPSDFFTKILSLPIVSELDFYGEQGIKDKIQEQENSILMIPRLIETALQNSDFEKAALYEKAIDGMQKELKRLNELLKQSAN